MADTISDVPLTKGTYVDLYAGSGIGVGTSIVIQNKTTKDIFVQEVAAQPSDDSDDGLLLGLGEQAIVTLGANGAWAKGSGPASVQVNG